MGPKPTMGRGFTAGGRKGTTKKGSYDYTSQYDGSAASIRTLPSKVNQGPFMDMAKGHGFNAARNRSGRRPAASGIRPKQGTRGSGTIGGNQ